MSVYRPDIDGLRGIAVGAVILFHAKFGGFSGGFVGVDVFFVISGFLISSIILADIHQDRFSILEFYERRIRRIFPALFVVLLFSFIVSYLIFLPSQFVQFGKSASATSFFVSNLYFAQDLGYFSGHSEPNPLLHTWSLSVEEQFYIVFPIALILAVRYFGRRVVASVLVVATISFAVSQWAVTVDPVAAFYLSPARAWELLIGYFLASGAVPKIRNATARNMGALLGLGLICWSVVYFTPHQPFPGVNALFPCLGAALVIHAGSSGPTAVGRMISLRPIVFVGLISYSLYLWHWPLLVFTRHYFIGIDLAPMVTATVIALAVALSVLTWKFIERPFRIPRNGSRSPAQFKLRSFRAACVVILTTAIAGLVVSQSEGLPNRFPVDVIKIATGTKPYEPLKQRCHDLPLSEVRQGNLCLIGAAGEPNFILWGDSHARAFLSATDFVAARRGYSGLYAGKSACPPLLGVTRPRRGENFRCTEFNDSVIAAIRSNRSIRNVIIAARWAMSADGHRYKHEPGSPIFIGDSMSRSVSFEENKAAFARGLRRTISQLAALGKKVTVIGPVPEVGWNVPKTLAMQKYLGVERRFSPSREEFEMRQAFVLRTMRTIANEFSVNLVFPHDLLCANERCSVQQNAKPLYSDDDHLSIMGAAMVLQTFESIIVPDSGTDRM